MKIKKFIALTLAGLMTMSIAACGGNSSPSSNAAQTESVAETSESSAEGTAETNAGGADLSSIKAGFIFLHDENSTYDLNFINSAKAAASELGLSEDQIILKTNIPEGQECLQVAEELADAGCSIIFADSFGHEDYMIEAAKEFPDVHFCHSTGTKAHTEGLPNYHNAFASIYQGRYLAGVAGGLKLNEMIEAGEFTAEEAKIGYIGAFTYAEVISGYTSFYLGVRSVCPTVTMDVTFTGSWYDETAEKEAANKLISGGCKLISQHADSMGAPTACETANVPNVSYNGSTVDACPNTFIVSSRIDWTPYFAECIKAVAEGTEIAADYTGTIATKSVQLTEVNENAAAEGTQAKLDELRAQMEAGTLQVYDTSTFTVTVDAEKMLNANATVDEEGHLTSYMADVDTDEAYQGDTEVVADGYFHESEYRSAPYFDLTIDGINLLDTQF